MVSKDGELQKKIVDMMNEKEKRKKDPKYKPKENLSATDAL